MNTSSHRAGSHRPDDDLFELFEKALEETLTAAEADDLKGRLNTCPQAREAYLQYTGLHAALHWHNVPVSDDENREFVACAGGPDEDDAGIPAILVGTPAPARPSWKDRVWRGLVAASVVLLAGLFVQNLTAERQRQSEKVVAFLLETKSCSWGEGTLPTFAGSTLKPGRVHLLKGLAEIRFTSGADVSLEGPAELEIIDPMNCILRSGTLVAEVPPSAEGFRVETESAAIIDYGTRFGVAIDSVSKKAEVQVFDGIVDVEHHKTTERKRLLEGDRAIVNSDHVLSQRTRSVDEEDEANEQVDRFADAQIVTTAQGLGQEGYVRRTPPKAGLFDTRFVVKSTILGRENTSKAYMSFDVSAFRESTIQDARLRLHMMPSPRGYASHVPDATFSVYGLIDGDHDFWTTDTLDWGTAPGNVDGIGVDGETTTLVGQFEIPQGQETGFVVVDGEPLAKFLDRDTNGVVTLIVVRDTLETEVRGLAHTFSRRRTPDGVPPMLFVVSDFQAVTPLQKK